METASLQYVAFLCVMGGIATARTPGVGRLPPKLKSPPLFAKTRMSDAEVSLSSDDVRGDKGEPRVP